MPFGLKTAPATFQRAMAIALAGLTFALFIKGALTPRTELLNYGKGSFCNTIWHATFSSLFSRTVDYPPHITSKGMPTMTS